MRQAVVIIHGIGEQKPMSTLKGFIDTIVKYEASQNKSKSEKFEKRYWSKPDNISESFELRKIVLGQLKSKSGIIERPTTDFFEYYWASNMRDTTFGHIIPWFKSLLLKNPFQLSLPLMFVWILSWVLTFAIIAGFLLFFSDDEFHIVENGILNKLISLLGTTVLIIFQKIIINYVGDAARYLTPLPSNIAERQKIRKDGIELLRKLHQAEKNGVKKYDRIVIVGHSLGSVIAYDIITHLWNDYNKIYDAGKFVLKSFFNDLKLAADNLDEALKQKQAPIINEARKEFFEKQLILYNELQKAGNPWRISDLITLGNPLSHALFLLAKNSNDLAERKKDRILLTCPPVLDNNGEYYYFDQKDKRYYLHHAAAFAATKWTNIYFPGDFIGGKISKVLGIGINDIKVEGKGLIYKIISRISPFMHTAYWRNKVALNQISKDKYLNAYKALYEAMDLKNEKRS